MSQPWSFVNIFGSLSSTQSSIHEVHFQWAQLLLITRLISKFMLQHACAHNTSFNIRLAAKPRSFPLWRTNGTLNWFLSVSNERKSANTSSRMFRYTSPMRHNRRSMFYSSPPQRNYYQGFKRLLFGPESSFLALCLQSKETILRKYSLLFSGTLIAQSFQVYHHIQVSHTYHVFMSRALGVISNDRWNRWL